MKKVIMTIVIALVFLGGIALGYFGTLKWGDKLIKDKETKEEVKIIDNDKLIKLDINSDKVKNVYNKFVLRIVDGIEEEEFLKEKLTLNDLSEKYKSIVAFEAYETYQNASEKFASIGTDYKVMPESDFIVNFKKSFGDNATYKFEQDMCPYFELIDGYVILLHGCGYASLDGENKIVDAEENNEYLYIYDEYTNYDNTKTVKNKWTFKLNSDRKTYQFISKELQK